MFACVCVSVCVSVVCVFLFVCVCICVCPIGISEMMLGFVSPHFGTRTHTLPTLPRVLCPAPLYRPPPSQPPLSPPFLHPLAAQMLPSSRFCRLVARQYDCTRHQRANMRWWAMGEGMGGVKRLEVSRAVACLRDMAHVCNHSVGWRLLQHAVCVCERGGVCREGFVTVLSDNLCPLHIWARGVAFGTD